jgi:hypothetical protein
LGVESRHDFDRSWESKLPNKLAIDNYCFGRISFALIACEEQGYHGHLHANQREAEVRGYIKEQTILSASGSRTREGTVLINFDAGLDAVHLLQSFISSS